MIADSREPTSIPAARPRDRGISKYDEIDFGAKVLPVERWEAGTLKNSSAHP